MAIMSVTFDLPEVPENTYFADAVSEVLHEPVPATSAEDSEPSPAQPLDELEVVSVASNKISIDLAPTEEAESSEGSSQAKRSYELRKRSHRQSSKRQKAEKDLPAAKKVLQERREKRDSDFDSEDVQSSSEEGELSVCSDSDSPISESDCSDAVSDALLGDERFLQNCKKALVSAKKILNKDKDSYCEPFKLAVVDEDMIAEFANWVIESFLETGVVDKNAEESE